MRPLTGLSVRCPPSSKARQGSSFNQTPRCFNSSRTWGLASPKSWQPSSLHTTALTCEWLLGNQDVIAALEEQQQQAIDINSPVMQRMLNDAKVQASFSETRIRQALEAMVKDPACTAMWLHDPIVGPVLVHMSQLLSTMEPDEPATE
eukprot:m.224740 g.224740  ORF g.224740 m.224740 type:complete len:148 (-) comp18775_c0_seq2:109-552(-)